MVPDMGSRDLGHGHERNPAGRLGLAPTRFEDAENVVEWTPGHRGASGRFLPPSVGARDTGSAIEVEFRYAYLWRFEEGKVVYFSGIAIPRKPSKPPGLE